MRARGRPTLKLRLYFWRESFSPNEFLCLSVPNIRTKCTATRMTGLHSSYQYVSIPGVTTVLFVEFEHNRIKLSRLAERRTLCRQRYCKWTPYVSHPSTTCEFSAILGGRCAWLSDELIASVGRRSHLSAAVGQTHHYNVE